MRQVLFAVGVLAAAVSLSAGPAQDARVEPDVIYVLTPQEIVDVMPQISYTLAITSPVGVLRIAEVAFAGFASLTLPALASLSWKRCTAQAAIASIVAAQVVLIGLWRGYIAPSWR